MALGSKLSQILKLRWRFIIAVLLGCGLTFGIVADYQFGWTWMGFNKSLWDWMQLLIIPVALAFVAIWFNRVERRNEQAISLDNQREGALQAYLDKMSDLLLKEGLRQSEQHAEVRNIARARTLTVLRKLDGKRKGSLLQFLYEAGLIDKDDCVIHLSGADLQGVDLRGMKLRNANLGAVDLSEADLRMADLSNAFLEETDLSGANLSGAILIDAFMACADLREADLEEADLREVNLEKAELGKINLSETFLVKGGLNLSNPNSKLPIYIGGQEYHPYLYGADLGATKLCKANLRKAYMWQADLHEANLEGANLRGAIITQEQMDKLKLNSKS